MTYKTLDEALQEAMTANSFAVGKVDSYYEDKWTKETGSVRSEVKNVKAQNAYGFKVGKHYFMINKNQKSKIGNVEVYRAVDEDNEHSILFVDNTGKLYVDDASVVAATKKNLSK